MQKVTIERTGKNLTTYAKLIPEMRFLNKFEFRLDKK